MLAAVAVAKLLEIRLIALQFFAFFLLQLHNLCSKNNGTMTTTFSAELWGKKVEMHK